MDPIALAAELVQVGPICDRCLGRRFAGLGGGLPNLERGRSLRAACQGGAPVPSERCWVCQGVWESLAERAREAAALVEDREFRTFLFGVHLTPRQEAVEEFLDERFPSPWAEPLRRDLNRELGQAFERALAEAGREATVDFARPDVQFTVDLQTGRIELSVAPVFFYGRYRKLVRGIPQTHWPCRSCRGRGCPSCGGSGKQYPISVEELVLPAFLAATGGSGGHLHGAGREDIDARMLGRGRPFVVEVKAPRRRTVDLERLADEINRSAQGQVEVLDLRPGSPELVARVKEERADKRYRARVALGEPVDADRFQRALAHLVGEVEQRTPERVRHRRADLVRRRRVHAAKGELLSPTEAEVEVLCQGGLYVKELISGDGGATQPNLAALLGVPARVSELDVLDVLDELSNSPIADPRGDR
ncbi:MAG: tRNA pseudouridine(54/55) synthase Pus10 [Candidatus Bipolaricaulota bacterium]|nr:tRNA pseudouridine(54/55) synthase Pus10 [Candidatus Bipolaricaulota bacterium]